MNVTKGQKSCMKDMIGIYESKTTLINNGKSKKQLFVNLPLFWNKSNRQYFPLIAASKSDLKIQVKFKKLSEISHVDGDEKVNISISSKGTVELKVGNSDSIQALGNLNAYLMFQTFILSPMEKVLFSRNNTDYIFKRLYVNSFDIKNQLTRVNLDFLHPTEWIAFIYKSRYSNDFEYSKVESLRMFFNGIERLKETMQPDFYRLLNKYLYFENCENDNIYVYSFCLKAGHGQNSGSINFGRIINKEVELSLHQNTNYNGTLYVIASSYNFLKCDGTKGKLLYY